MKNYADRGGCYPPKPKAEADNTLRDLHNSSYHVRKPNSIIALLFIQNISRALKIYKFFLIGFCRVHGKIARYLKTMNKKQEKNDQQNFIQGSDKFAVRSQIRMNFSVACTEPTQYNLASFGRNSISSTNRNCTALRLKFQELFKLT